MNSLSEFNKVTKAFADAISNEYCSLTVAIILTICLVLAIDHYIEPEKNASRSR